TPIPPPPPQKPTTHHCWLSDRDRFSYEGLNSDERLTAPMIKQDGKWIEVDWPAALSYAAHALARVRDDKGGPAIGGLGSANSTVEELHLLAKLIRGLGSENVDYRLRQRDFSLDASFDGVPWLGMKVAEIDSLDRLLLVGSFLRKDHPLLASRVRRAVKRGAQVCVIHGADDDLLMPVAAKLIAAPSRWPELLAQVLVGVLRARQLPVPETLAGIEPDAQAGLIADSLASGKSTGILFGNAAVQCDRFGILAQFAQSIAQASGARFGLIGEAANSVGGALAGALPGDGGLNAREMIVQPRAAYLLLGNEPAFDHGMPQIASTALAAADTVIALTAYRSEELLDKADCLLPVTPATETAGTFVNAEGSVQSFNGVVRPRGNARPAWKVLRVLGNLLEMPGFEFDSPEAVREAALQSGVQSRLSNQIAPDPKGLRLVSVAAVAAGEVERLADVPLYFSDGVVRRAPSLQQVSDSQPPRARMNASTLQALGVSDGDLVRVAQGQGEAHVKAELDPRVANGVVRLAAAHASTATLSSMFGVVRVSKA
ncbi:MAG: molybdopterin-dependent oxidoreductase, partial [Quisquiliibacterium sp.]